MSAAQQVAQTGTPHQTREAAGIVNTARKALYRLLAEDDTQPGTEPGTAPTDL